MKFYENTSACHIMVKKKEVQGRNEGQNCLETSRNTETRFRICIMWPKFEC